MNRTHGCKACRKTGWVIPELSFDGEKEFLLKSEATEEIMRTMERASKLPMQASCMHTGHVQAVCRQLNRVPNASQVVPCGHCHPIAAWLVLAPSLERDHRTLADRGPEQQEASWTGVCFATGLLCPATAGGASANEI